MWFNLPSEWKEEYTKYPNGFSLLEMLRNWVSIANNLGDKVDNLLTDGLDQPLRDRLAEMGESGELASYITEAIVIDGGGF